MRVALASKPRNAMVAAPTAVFEPFSLLETGTPFAFDTVRLRRSSSVLRSPDLLIRSRVTFRTGFGPTSAAVGTAGMADPVMNMRSVLASSVPFSLNERTVADSVVGGAWARTLVARTRGRLTARDVRKNPRFANPILFINVGSVAGELQNAITTDKNISELFRATAWPSDQPPNGKQISICRSLLSLSPRARRSRRTRRDTCLRP